jgi:hypothetical protein
VARRLRYYADIPSYCWYHKHVFNVTNTKFDISYCVFRESFVHDQYGIRRFLDQIGPCRRLFFLDIGRNHGFVFYYTMYHIMKTQKAVSVIDYYGIDPSPLKFVYFNFHEFLKKANLRINYNIIDRAVVFGQEPIAILKYGERNFGNFHVFGSNYAAGSSDNQSKFEYAQIIVETMQFSEVVQIIERNLDADAIIVKIDCKNRTDQMFMAALDLLSGRNVNYLIACEKDGSSERDSSAYIVEDPGVLRTANVVAANRA